MRVRGLVSVAVVLLCVVAGSLAWSGAPAFALGEPPSIDSAAAVNVTASSADLTARIDPRESNTVYRFEYGTSTGYGTNVPVPDGAVGAAAGDQTVTQHVTGLQADTTYHFRVIAQSIAGITTGVDHTFVYDTSGEGLPDNRAYEMVTPPQKNGVLISDLFAGLRPDFSEDGSRVFITSIGCFAGAEACNANRGNQGTPVSFTRESSGWVASGLMPPASQFDAASSVLDSANADTALFLVPTPSGGEDLLSRSPDGSFANIGPVTPPSLGLVPDNAQVGGAEASADLSHIIYELKTEFRWPFDATSTGQSQYEYVGAGSSAPVLVDVSGGAGSTSLISTCGAGSLGLLGIRYNPLSADGRVAFFIADACASGSGANAGVQVPANTLYARIGGSQTALISGRSPLGCTTPACLASTPRDAEFRGASTDGSRVFFTSTQQLTDDASEGAQNLYEYDFSRPAGENLIAVSAGDTSGGGPGVTGAEAISSDGSHVYFAATGVLTGVANSQGQLAQAGAENLYLFELDARYPRGRTVFIATLPPSDQELEIHRVLYSGEPTTQGFAGGVGGANVTPDGRFLVFMSHGRLTPDDTRTNEGEQVYRYDALADALIRISVGERGFDDDGNAGMGNATIVPAEETFRVAGASRPDPTMSHDGAFVFFESPVALTPHALHDVPVGTFFGQPEYAENIYEWHDGHVHLISDGRDTSALGLRGTGVSVTDGESAVELIGSDATGANVFFTSGDRLASQDTDTQLDYYDARICTQDYPCVVRSSTAQAPCAGEACRTAPGAPPSLVEPVSASFSGAGNFAAETKPAVKAKRKAKPKKARKRLRKGKRRTARKDHKAKKGSVGSTGRGR